jgi:hypothetical protein
MVLAVLLAAAVCPGCPTVAAAKTGDAANGVEVEAVAVAVAAALYKLPSSTAAGGGCSAIDATLLPLTTVTPQACNA